MDTFIRWLILWSTWAHSPVEHVNISKIKTLISAILTGSIEQGKRCFYTHDRVVELLKHIGVQGSLLNMFTATLLNQVTKYGYAMPDRAIKKHVHNMINIIRLMMHPVAFNKMLKRYAAKYSYEMPEGDVGTMFTIMAEALLSTEANYINYGYMTASPYTIFLIAAHNMVTLQRHAPEMFCGMIDVINKVLIRIEGLISEKGQLHHELVLAKLNLESAYKEKGIELKEAEHEAYHQEAREAQQEERHDVVGEKKLHMMHKAKALRILTHFQRSLQAAISIVGHNSMLKSSLLKASRYHKNEDEVRLGLVVILGYLILMEILRRNWKISGVEETHGAPGLMFIIGYKDGIRELVDASIQSNATAKKKLQSIYEAKMLLLGKCLGERGELQEVEEDHVKERHRIQGHAKKILIESLSKDDTEFKDVANDEKAIDKIARDVIEQLLAIYIEDYNNEIPR